MADDETGTTAEDTTLTVNAAAGLLVGDTDLDGDAPSVTLFVVAGTTAAAGVAANLAAGDLTIFADGSYTFVPAANFNGAVPVATYTVTDGNGGSDTGTLTIAVTAVNDAPVVAALLADATRAHGQSSRSRRRAHSPTWTTPRSATP